MKSDETGEECDCPDAGELVLAVDAEDSLERFKRLGLLLLSALALAGIFWMTLSGDAHVFANFTTLIVFIVVASSLGQRRMLILGNHSLRVLGEGSDRPMPWREVDRIEFEGPGATVVFKRGRRRPLPLSFLTPAVRCEAIIRLIRHLDIHRLCGPFLMPSPADIEIGEGRVRLRPLDGSDRDLAIAIATSQDSFEFQLAGIGSPEMAGKVFDETMPHFRQGKLSWRFAIVVDGVRVGALSVVVNDPILRHAQLGIDILSPHQNRGYGSEAVRTALAFFRSESNLMLVTAGCFSDNLRCRRALEKAGMKHRGSLAKFWLKEDSWKVGEHLEMDFAEPSPEEAGK